MSDFPPNSFKGNTEARRSEKKEHMFAEKSPSTVADTAPSPDSQHYTNRAPLLLQWQLPKHSVILLSPSVLLRCNFHLTNQR